MRAEEPPLGEAAQIEGPMRPDAQALYDRGLQRFQAHDYANATADFEAGYGLEPRREFLFAEGQAKRLGGDCKTAVALYQRFLTSEPPAVQVNATHIALARCAQVLADHPDVLVVAPPPPKPPPPAPPPRWWRDPFGLVATGAGVVGLGIGVGFWIASDAARDGAPTGGLLADYASAWSTAQSRRNVAVATLAIGGTLTVAGVVRLVLLRRRAARQDPGLGVSILPGAVAFGGRF